MIPGVELIFVIETDYFGTMLDLGYDRFGINGATLANIGVPGGNVRYNHIYKSFACGLHSGDLWFPVVDARREHTPVPEFNCM